MLVVAKVGDVQIWGGLQVFTLAKLIAKTVADYIGTDVASAGYVSSHRFRKFVEASGEIVSPSPSEFKA